MEFHNCGIINQSTNATCIMLVPKRSHTNKIKNVKPISLVKSLYKIIAKVLLGHTRGVFHETIHISQRAFAKGRQT